MISRQFTNTFTKSLTVAALTVGLAASAAYGQTFLTEDEMLAAFPGHQVQGTNKAGKPWVQVYSAGGGKHSGNYNGVEGSGKYKGKWMVKDGKWCEHVGDWSGCYNFVRKNDKTFIAYKDGQKQREWMITK